MSDYNKYTYSKLLDFLHNSYLHDTERTDYAEYLLSMESETTLEGMMKIYDSVITKLSKLIFSSIPEHWYIFELWSGQEYLALDVHRCLNENILKLYFSQKNPSNTFCYKCLANLRPCDNINDIHNSIVKKQGSLDENILQNIEKTREIIYSSKKDAYIFSPGTNGFNQTTTTYLNSRAFLDDHGFIESVIESNFESHKGIAHHINKYSQVSKIIVITIILIAVIFIILMLVEHALGIILFIGACLAIPSLIKGR